MNKDIIKELIERDNKESQAAYRAFISYATLAPSTRANLSKTIKDLADKHGFAESSIKQFRKDFRWEERLSSIETSLMLDSYARREKEMDKETDIFLANVKKIRDEAMLLPLDMLKTSKKILAEINVANEVIETDIVETKDGRKVPTTTEVILKTKPSDVNALAKTALSIVESVKNLTAPSSNTLPKITNINIASDKKVEDLNDEELGQKLKDIRKEVTQREKLIQSSDTVQ